MRAAAFATAVALFLAGPALADGPITTAPAAGPASPQPTAPSPELPRPGEAPPQGPQMAMGPCGPEKVKPDGSLEKAPHGEVEAGLGTGGYREIGGSVCQPLGKDGFVAISAGQTQGDYGYRRR
jgi:hypothetical protein